MFDLQNNYLDEDDPWSGILVATYFAVQSTYHTELQATPVHIVFRRDMILNNPFMAYWGSIRLCHFKKEKYNQTENNLTAHL